MKAFKQSIRMLKYNFVSVFLYEIAYRILSAAILIPTVYGLLDYSVEVAKIPYLATGTLNKYLKTPYIYGILLLIIFILAFFLLINLSGLIYVMEASVQQKKVNPLDIIIHGFKNALRALVPSNWGLLFYAFLILPFTYTVILSGSLLGLKMPEFFRHFLEVHKFGVMGVAAVYILLCLAFFHQFFLLNYFSLYEVSFEQASRMSRNALSKKRLKLLVGTIVLNVSMTVLMVLIEGALSTGVASLMSGFVAPKTMKFTFDIILRVVVLLMYIIAATVATPQIFAYICACFYERENDKEFKIFEKTDLDESDAERLRLMSKHVEKRKRVYVISVLILALVGNIGYFYLVKHNYVALKVVYPTTATITAHRGDAGHAPENTMIAFETAVENQADIIEIDVRQTKDGEYIIMHDESLFRTAGTKRKVGEVDYDYVSRLDVGSLYDRSFDGERIPTLRQVLEFAVDNKIFLNIELKPAVTDTNYLDGILALLEEYDFYEQCVIASQDYQLLCKAKALNPDIKTVYIMPMAFGKFGDMANVDVFSIKYTYLSNSMVKDIHDHGKEVYAWTVKHEDDVKQMLLLDVDSIITDYPYEIREYMSQANNSMLGDFLKRILYEY